MHLPQLVQVPVRSGDNRCEDLIQDWARECRILQNTAAESNPNPNPIPMHNFNPMCKLNAKPYRV